MTDKEYRKDRIDTLADNVAKLADRFDVLSDDAVRHAISGTLNSRTGRMLASAPTFRKRPLASLLYRHIQWHQGSGNLHGMFSVKWDAGYLARYTPETRFGPNPIFEHDQNLVAGLTESELHDRLETTALILTHGESPALDKWRKALHGS
jgi:hypothetical protein